MWSWWSVGGTVTTGTNESSGGVDVHKVKRATLVFQGSTTKKRIMVKRIREAGDEREQEQARVYVVGGMAWYDKQ